MIELRTHVLASLEKLFFFMAKCMILLRTWKIWWWM